MDVPSNPSPPAKLDGVPAKAVKVITMIPGRNDPCPCGSGKKYKRCCGVSSSPKIMSGDVQSVERAITAFQQGKTREALVLAGDLLQSMPDNPDLLQVYAMAQLRLGDAVASRAHMERAISLRPDNAWMHSNLALILQASGLLDAAEQHCRIALKLDPRLADAHNNLGNVLKDKRQLEVAAEHYQEAIRLEPAHPLFHYNYGTLLPLLGKSPGKSKEAEAALKRTIELDPAFASAYTNLGALYLLQGRLDEARQYLHRAVSFRPLDPQAFVNYGLVLQRQGSLDEAHT